MDNTNFPKPKIDPNDAYPLGTGVVGGPVGPATGTATGQTVAEKINPK